MARRLRPALEAATRTAQETAAQWRAHRQGCHECHQAKQDSRPALACEPGFRLWQATDIAAREEIRRRDTDAAQAALQATLGA